VWKEKRLLLGDYNEPSVYFYCVLCCLDAAYYHGID